MNRDTFRIFGDLTFPSEAPVNRDRPQTLEVVTLKKTHKSTRTSPSRRGNRDLSIIIQYFFIEEHNNKPAHRC